MMWPGPYDMILAKAFATPGTRVRAATPVPHRVGFLAGPGAARGFPRAVSCPGVGAFGDGLVASAGPAGRRGF